MDLGNRIKLLRAEKGMTQTQLAADHITRNMLSQIENGSAVPSFKTLQYLAQRLEVTVGDLLGEQRTDALSSAREKLRLGDFEGAAEAALTVTEHEEERAMLLSAAFSQMAKQSLMNGAFAAAEQAAEQALLHNDACLYRSKDTQAEMLGVLAHCRMGTDDADDAMQQYKKAYRDGGWEAKYHLLTARHLLLKGQTQAAEREIWTVTALSDEERPLYLLLRGWIAVHQEKYSSAISYLQQVERQDIKSPCMLQDLYRLFETAYKELGDYKTAYEYAAKQREK